MVLFGVKKHVDQPIFFIARNYGIPYLIVREGKVTNFHNHHYYINSGGQSFFRHEDEIFFDEDRAWTALNAGFTAWLRIYSE